MYIAMVLIICFVQFHFARNSAAHVYHTIVHLILSCYLVHDYGYSRRFYDDDKYKIPRMASEYGLQSLPSYETLASVYDPEDLFYDSPLNKHRQHHPNGSRVYSIGQTMFKRH